MVEWHLFIIMELNVAHPPLLIDKVATAIEQCGWETVDILQMNNVMARATIAAIYDVLVDHAQQSNREDVIEWLIASPIGNKNSQR
ncbi:hypothetical protein Q644_26015 [Brucella intermedia 229E]|uniref:Uncharacterized protein n=1 Tax=Brucella intermedia 229E TaxID=1337887 RepID=U4V3K3_9HYPH|nr:hypothetical protein Q644_26015 [Brucella intermedia 229E]